MTILSKDMWAEIARGDCPVIDPTLSDQLEGLSSLNTELYEAHYRAYASRSAAERQGACNDFAQGVYELTKITTYLQGQLAEMREALATYQSKKFLPLRKPRRRDARGRFVRLTP